MTGLVIHYFSKEVPLDHTTYRVSTANASTPILGEVDFNPLSHNMTMISGQTFSRAKKAHAYGAQNVESMSEFTVYRHISMVQEIQMGKWFNILPYTQSLTYLGKQEFCNKVLIRYQARPKELQEKCDGCATNKPLTLKHALKCKVGGLVTGCHKGVYNSLSLMVMQTFTSYSVHDEPLISSSQDITGMRQPYFSINSIL